MKNLNRQTIIRASFLVAAVFFSFFQSFGQFSGVGSGTELNPYIVTNPTQLDEVRNDLNAYYELGNDIDLTFDTSDPAGGFYNAAAGWEPIPSITSLVGATPFSGSFDGNGHMITGLFLDRSPFTHPGASSYLGLFSYLGETPTPTTDLRNGEIKNLTLEVTMNGGNVMGGLVGFADANTTISNCNVSGNMMGENSTGGLVGTSSGSIIESSSHVNVVGLSGVGGLVGSNSSSIQRSFSTGNVSGSINVGGLAGLHSNGTISDSYSTSEVFGTQGAFINEAGGLVGVIAQINGPRVINGYATGTVSFADASLGTGNGALGRSRFDVLISGDRTSGVFFDYASCNDKTTNVNYGIGKITIEMSSESTFIGYDFSGSGSWAIDEGASYPYLKWQGSAASFNSPPSSIPDPIPIIANLPDFEAECSVDTTPTPPTATDACGRTLEGTTDALFPITAQGTTEITWTYTSITGEVSTQTQEIVVDDITAPQSDALADFESACEVTASQLGTPTTNDNCGEAVQGVPDLIFPITTQGTTVVTWTFTDANGNSSMEEQSIIINDDVVPVPDVAVLADLIGDCDSEILSATPPTATDNCVGMVTGTTDAIFPITTLGETEITWTYDDGNGNTSTQTQTLLIRESDAVIVTESLCEGANFTFPDGTVWTGQTSQVSTLTNQLSCDSLVTTNITVLPLPEVDLGDAIVFGCVEEEFTFSIDESSISFDTYTISTLFGNSSLDGPLSFTFDQTFASTAATQDVFVTIELTDANGCVGTDQVLLKDNTMVNWGIGAVQNNDPVITISSTILPETADSFEWDFGDGTTNNIELNPSHTYTENGDYTIALTASNECGDESLSQSLSISTIIPLSLNDSSPRAIVYPNPTSKFIFFVNERTISVSLFSLDGKKMISAMIKPSGSLDISSVATGQYFLYIFDENHLLRAGKIIKKN